MAKCKTVMIVEDDPAIRSALIEIVKSEGYDVIGCEDGIDALTRLKKFKEAKNTCLIICDLMMPNMNGWQLIEMIDQDTSLCLIPMLVLSAQEANLPPGKKYMKKPVHLDNLIHTIKEHCGPATNSGT